MSMNMKYLLTNTLLTILVLVIARLINAKAREILRRTDRENETFRQKQKQKLN